MMSLLILEHNILMIFDNELNEMFGYARKELIYSVKYNNERNANLIEYI